MPGNGIPERPRPDRGDTAFIGRSMADVAERSQRIVNDWLRRQSRDLPQLDPMNVSGAFMDMMAKLMANPTKMVQAQIGFWQDYLTLWQNTTRRMWGMEPPPVIRADPADRRFKDDAWNANEVFDFIKQSYLLSARYVQDVVGLVEGLDKPAADRVDFYTRQFIDAMSPSNFLLTNPEVLRRTAETGGENLLKGLNNLLSDLERGRGRLTFRAPGLDAFRLGTDIAASPGKVVFENRLMQLIQYAPTTARVLRRPLLVVPPWTNKFYVLDLRPRTSFVRWAVAQGHTVFMLSWIDPDETLTELGFDDYLRDGVLAALDTIEHLTGERGCNAVGYGLGGTLLSVALAFLAAGPSANDHANDHADDRAGNHADDRARIGSATLLTTMLDFQEAGELGVFIDEEQLRSLENAVGPSDLPPGAGRTDTHTMLRANDLIWSFVVNNYLLGNDPFPFDLLYWNSDSVRLPGQMHAFYLRSIYQQNLLATPDGITAGGRQADLSRVSVPTYFLSAREDHIAPWKGTYRGVHLLGGPCRFVLAASGHVAGVVNPPEGGKYSHWVNPDLPPTAEEWFGGATEISGSWWPDWQRWVAALDRTEVSARQPGAGGTAALEDAPGRYVQKRPA